MVVGGGGGGGVTASKTEALKPGEVAVGGEFGAGQRVLPRLAMS